MASYDLTHVAALRDLRNLANRQKAKTDALKTRVAALENKGA